MKSLHPHREITEFGFSNPDEEFAGRAATPKSMLFARPSNIVTVVTSGAIASNFRANSHHLIVKEAMLA